MNRNEEYQTLLMELENTPPALAYSVQRAKARQKKRQRVGRFFGVPAGSLVAFLLTFTLLVNFLPTFAQAVSRIPLLAELAEAVAWSPTLSAAVENEYIQPMGLEQTVNDITARIEHVIVDKKQLLVFYTLNSEVYPNLEASGPKVHDLEGFSTSSSSFRLENGTLSQFAVIFGDGTMPNTLRFTLPVRQWEEHSPNEPPTASLFSNDEERAFYEEPSQEPEPLAAFEFTLKFDPYFTEQGETRTLNREFLLDGQRIILTTVEQYPTSLRLSFTADEENTAWLEDMDFYLENERGERFEGVKNGISSMGDIRGYGEKTFFIESDFFSRSKELTLHIQRAYWLDKDKETIRIDLENSQADWLPEHIKSLEVKRFDSGWTISVEAEKSKENHAYSVFTDMRGEDGTSVENTGNSTEILSEEETFRETTPIRDYTGTVLLITPTFSRMTDFEKPVSIPVQ